MLRLAYVAGFLILGVAYHYILGYGPTPSEIYDEFEWWRPRGYVHEWLIFSGLSEMARDTESSWRLLPVLLFSLPPLALFAAGLALFRQAWLRAGVFWLTLTLCSFAYYGLVSDRVWRFFQWRFPLVVTSFAAVIAISLFGPSLLRDLRSLPRWAGGALIGALFVLIFVLSTEVTGTNPDMSFNISPWPVVTVFGFLMVGFLIAALHAGAGAGIYVRGRLGRAAGIGTALVAGGLLAFVPFSSPSWGQIGFTAVVSAIYAATALALGDPDRTPVAASGLSRIATAALLVIMVGISNTAAKRFQRVARDETAASVLVALEAYKTETGEYPERLRNLVPKYLPEVPRPQIGFLRDEHDVFTYSKYAQEDFSLEFASVQWVQCAYSPPYEFAAYDDEEEEEEGFYDDEDVEKELWEEFDSETTEDVGAGSRDPTTDQLEMAAALEQAGLVGAWSCATEPPKLW